MASTTQKKVDIKPAKGRPMLTWVGKRPLRHVTAFPAQLVETFSADPKPHGNPTDGGMLLHGDNKDVLAYLLANGYRGMVKLVCIDPPFDSGANYVRKVQLRGVTGAAKMNGEEYTIGEQIQYTDIWANDNYLQFMYERLCLLKELLSVDGTIYLHCDQRRVHHLRCLLDEVFGADNFINEIIWQHQIMGGSHQKRFPKAHETVLWYSKGDSYRLRAEEEDVRVPFSKYVLNSMKQDEDGQYYYERRRMSRKATVEEAASKAHTRTYVESPDDGTVATDLWSDMLSYQEVPDGRQGAELYPTQKTIKLLTRLVSAASAPSDLVLDCFAGSGTTAVVAQMLGRRWIGCDINKGAIQTTAKRLQMIMREQSERPAKLVMVESDDSEPKPAQLSFAVYRINDYDLHVQHNEAVTLACEYLGIDRTRTDSFFDGRLGKKLVKIVPFNHPLTPLDLEDVKRELAARPDEDRDVVVVCLGKELAADAWLKDYNQMRRKGDVPNKIEVIELRTDPKYGQFFEHQPATAKVSFKRAKGNINVVIEDYVSPTIVQRLSQQAGVVQAQIDDWRAMVDSVMIDSAYNGDVFNIVLSDVPERKTDLVKGEYLVPAPANPSTVAVKITDMLGEELVVLRSV